MGHKGEFFYDEDGDALKQLAQRSCRHSVP